MKKNVAFFSKKIPSHEVINFKYIIPVFLVFVKPIHLPQMMTVDLRELFFLL